LTAAPSSHTPRSSRCDAQPVSAPGDLCSGVSSDSMCSSATPTLVDMVPADEVNELLRRKRVNWSFDVVAMQRFFVSFVLFRLLSSTEALQSWQILRAKIMQLETPAFKNTACISCIPPAYNSSNFPCVQLVRDTRIQKYCVHKSRVRKSCVHNSSVQI
jgi:hypothetical protein